MLVKELIYKIENKEIKIKDLALQFEVSDRTIQNKIKNLGYKWDSKNSKYDYVGADPEPTEIEFDRLFSKKDNNSKKIVNDPTLNKNEKSLKNNDDINKIVNKKVNESNKKVSGKENDSEYDIIDVLLERKPKSERVYRGFYFDKDIIEIIDSVEKRKKSELVNQVLRKVFKEKGLLK